MAQRTSLYKRNKGRRLYDNNLTSFIKRSIHPFLLNLASTKVIFKMEECFLKSGNRSKIPKTRGIIFACNHTNSHDVPIALKSIGCHAYIFAGTQPLGKIDELFFNLNGTIYVDRKNPADTKLSKEALIENLKLKRRILVCPEGTWNMTDARLMLMMKWGIIEVAQRARAVIVPMALDYDYDKKICRYMFGKPMDVRGMTLKDGIDCLRDSMATLRWYLFEKRGIYRRKKLNIDDERRLLVSLVEEYPKLDYEYEKSVVFKG